MSDLTPYQGGELSVARHPDTVLAEASLVAKSVDRLVKSRQDLVQVIGGRKHPRFELLQIVGSMFRVTARVVQTTHIPEPDGWEAIAEAVHIPTGQVLARGEGMCSADEPMWHMRPKYEWRGGKRERVGEEPVTSHQRRSMAQTRACSKALRLALGWVLGLAGYEATAAEELDSPDAAPQPQVRRKSQRVISVQQQKLLWAAARGRGLGEQRVAEIIETFGYRRTSDILAEDLDRIMEAISRAPVEQAQESDPFTLQEAQDDQNN